MALLLPAALSHNRHANDSSDIRRNLRMRYHDSYKHNRDHEYCVEFEVIKSSKACHKLPPYNLMLEGDRITVRCDLEAFIQDSIASSTTAKPPAPSHAPLPSEPVEDGEESSSSSGSSDDSNNKEEDDEEQDNEPEEQDDLQNTLDTGSNESFEYRHQRQERRNPRKPRNPIPVTPPSTVTPTPAPSYHCRGEGLAGRTTRWTALPAPSCRGKWLRLTVGPPKKCNHAQFIFV